MDVDIELSDAELRMIRDSLDYSVQRVSEFPHREYQQKLASLQPIEAVREKVRQLIAIRKEANRGR